MRRPRRQGRTTASLSRIGPAAPGLQSRCDTLPQVQREAHGFAGDFPIPTLLGIDLGGTKVALTLGDERGDVRRSVRHPTDPSGDPDRDVARIVELARGLLDEDGGDVLAGVGISAPGPIDAERGLLIDPPNLPGWGRVDLRTPFERALGAPVHLENDANAAALAEWRFGAGRGLQHMVYLTMSTGIGGGLVLGGRIHRGIGPAGEIGHVPVAWGEDAPRCNCGLCGCLEAHIGGAALARRLQAITPRDSRVAALAGGVEFAEPVHLVQAAHEGDAFARVEMERFVEILARGLVMLTFTLAPEAFVLGTIAIAAGDALCFDPLRARVRERIWPGFRDVRILPAALGNRLAGLAGLCAALELGAGGAGADA